MVNYFLENAKIFATKFIENPKASLLEVLMLVSIIIFLVGCIKPLIKNIKNNNLKKVVLSFSSLIVTLPVVLVYFWIKHYSYNLYWFYYIIVSISTIILYWFYENTLLRNLFNLLNQSGKNIVVNGLKSIVKDNVDETQSTKTETLKNDFLESVKKEQYTIKKSIDNDLKNL